MPLKKTLNKQEVRAITKQGNKKIQEKLFCPCPRGQRRHRIETKNNYTPH